MRQQASATRPKRLDRLGLSIVILVALAGCAKHLDQADRENWNLAADLTDRCKGESLHDQIDLAIQDCTRSIALKPDLAAPYNNRGTAYEYKQQHDLAIADYDQAIKLQPDLAAAFVNRGNARRSKHQYELAIQDYDQAIRLQPDLWLAYDNRGITYMRLGKDDRALQDFDQALKLQPNNVYVIDNRGVVYLDQGKYDLARQAFEQGIANWPNGPAIGERGWLELRLNELDRAAADFETAMHTGTPAEHGIWLYGRGLVKQRKGDLAGAQKDIAASHYLNPQVDTVVTQYHIN